MFKDLILSFMRDAGEIAINSQDKILNQEKPDKSIVTQADLDISHLFESYLSDLVNTGDNVIIDEEKPCSVSEAFHKINTRKYTWIIDPIDGTSPYFNGLPFWGIAVALYENKKPYMSFMFFPQLKQLVYCENGNVYKISNPFSDFQKKEKISLQKRSFTNQSIILGDLHCFPKDIVFDHSKAIMMDLYSAYVFALYTVLGNTAGAFIGTLSSLWDIAATIPIAKCLGLKLFNVNNDKPIDELSQDVINDNWKLKDTYLLCHPDNYESIKKIIKL
jgi:myo-inositol-1(or 4)-monophosphatase